MYPKFTKPTEMKKGGKKKKSSSTPKPTNPSLWSRAKAQAKSKFDVYPSAYANAWASKWYKSKGGGWRGGSKKKAEGGPISYEQGASEGDLMKIQNGGTHEESPLGGVPIGKDADGREVLVEEGETIRKGPEEDFVFSDRLKLTKQEAEEFGIDKKFVGQSFATVSEKLEKRSPRKSDPIDKQTLDMHLNRLEEAQETFKQRKFAEAKEMYGDPEAEMQQGPEGQQPMHQMPDGTMMPGATHEEAPQQEGQQQPSPEMMQQMMAMQEGMQGMPPQGMPQGMPPGMPAGMPQGAAPMMMPYGGPHNKSEYGYGDETNVPNYMPFSNTRNTVPSFNPMPSFLQASQEQLDQSALESNYMSETNNSALDMSALEDAESRGAAENSELNSLQKFLSDAPGGESSKFDYNFDNYQNKEKDKKGGKEYGAGPEDSGDSKNTKEFPEYETPKGLNALQAAPIATNLVTAAMLPEQFDFDTYKLPKDDNILQKKDITPMIRDVERMVATGRGALQSRAGSVSELLAGLSNLTALGMAETGKIRNQQYADYTEALRNQQLFNLNIAKTNSEMKAAVDTANADLEKERLSLINSAATEASKFADALRQEGLSKYELEQLYAMYPYLQGIN